MKYRHKTNVNVEFKYKLYRKINDRLSTSRPAITDYTAGIGCNWNSRHVPPDTVLFLQIPNNSICMKVKVRIKALVSCLDISDVSSPNPVAMNCFPLVSMMHHIFSHVLFRRFSFLGRQCQHYSQVLVLFLLSSSARSVEATEMVKAECESNYQVGGGIWLPYNCPWSRELFSGCQFMWRKWKISYNR